MSEKTFWLYKPHHESLYGRSVSGCLKRWPRISKYGYLLDNGKQFERHGFRLGILLGEKKGSFALIFRAVALIYIYTWLIFNRYPFLNVRIAFSKNSMREGDALFFFIRQLDRNRDEIYQLINQQNVQAICHFCHFHNHAERRGKLFRSLGAKVVPVFESNLRRDSALFQAYYEGHSERFIVIPFVVQPRFANLNSFDYRKKKVLISGSLTYIDKIDDGFSALKSVYGRQLRSIHPKRQYIYENPYVCPELVDCAVDLIEPSPLGAYVNSYYKKEDILSLYNQYQFYAAEVDVAGAPAIAAVEGMACGSVLLSESTRYLEDWGLSEGQHFLSWDGSYNGIRTLTGNAVLMRQISEQAAMYAIENFAGNSVISALVTQLSVNDSCVDSDHVAA